MTAHPEIALDVDQWRGEWINFYQYRGGQQHFGLIISATKDAADEVRIAWFRQAAEEQTRNGLVLAYHLPAREAFFVPEEFDRFSDCNPIVVKVRNCTFSIAVPYVPPERPQDDHIPF